MDKENVNKKIIIITGIIITLITIIYILNLLIPVTIYDSKTSGKEINNEKDVNLCKNIINKKYEIILYGRYEELKKLYIDSYKDKIIEFNDSILFNKLLDKFYIVTIDNIERKLNNTYIVKHTLMYSDYSQDNITTIIKFNYDKTKATIIYDDIFEVK